MWLGSRKVGLPETGRQEKIWRRVTRPGNAQTADVRGPEPRPAVELPILPHIAPVSTSIHRNFRRDCWWLGLLSTGIDKRWRPGRTYFPESHFEQTGGSTQQNESSGRVRRKSTHPGATWPEGIRCTLSGSECVALRARHRRRPSVQKQRPRSAYP